MKIYTRTGDTGTTGLLGGDRIAKDSPRITAIGEVDELNASLGVAIAANPPSEIAGWINRIQSQLFDIGAELACPVDSDYKIDRITPEDSEELESEIDQMESKLAPLTNFILPGGTAASANLHLSRSVCRRAERAVFNLSRSESVSTDLVTFLNRLSDWLFTAARASNAAAGVADEIWSRRARK